METFHENMHEYRKQLQRGALQKAYRGLMDYLQSLRTHFQKTHPELAVPGGLYFGYMDMSYFSIVPESLKQRNLKVALVFLHKEFRFEVWLAAANKQVQTKYWQTIKESGWEKYRLVPATQGYDAIIEHILVDNPDFSDFEVLTKQVEKGTLTFILDVESFLSEH
jgi:hypothetical protein